MIAPPYQQLAYKKNKKQQLIIIIALAHWPLLLKSEEKTIIHVDRYR